MTQEDAAFRFRSWLRRGAASAITAKDKPNEPAGAGVRTSIPASVRFNCDDNFLATTNLALHGPGDVVGFDGRAVVRAWPPPSTRDAEPNYFPLVEFDQVDLPWRYTPRAKNDATRLRPWLCLIVAREDEITGFTPARADRKLDAVTIAAATPMPNLDQSWAWAHVQVSGDDGVPIATVVAGQPERCLARLLCPRRLDANTTYWAMLVPVFEVGRLAGLRLPLGNPTSLATAWNGTALTAPLELPIYHRWTFGTGAGGDFESLVRLLVPRPLPPTVGTRDLDVASAGDGLPAAASGALRLGGALRAPGAAPGTGPTSSFITALSSLLNLPATVEAAGGTPVVAPPLYGTWHARKAKLESGVPTWFQQLNEDPRTRVAAALGTEVIQLEQQKLMASAWDQVDGIREANDQLRKAQLARAIGERLHRRFIASADAATLVVLTARVHGHVLRGTRTVRSLAINSPTRLALQSGAYRRLARPLGPLGRRQSRADRVEVPVIGAVNAGTYDSVLVAVPPRPGNIIDHLWIRKYVPSWGPPTAAQVTAAPPLRRVIAWDPILGGPAPGGPIGPAGQDSPSMALFRQAAVMVLRRDVTPAGGEILRRLDLSAIRTTLTTTLDPRTTIPAGLAARLVRALGFAWNPPDPIEPVMAHPVFPQPMYKPLAELSADWMLPGLGEVLPDTVTLAETNPPFIEAYMVGLNHEMSRELLWNEYPTDQRGSYFRQFWDPAGLFAPPVPDTAKDIHPVHAWTAASALGAHSPRPTPPGGAHLVLMVRGEVLRRYPGTLVYAQRAQRSGGTYVLGTDVLQPVFAGRLAPDVAFFGFALTKAMARGTGTAADPGWFFVFEEQPGEPKFGLDVSSPTANPGSWNDLAWTHLVTSPAELANLHYIDLGATRPITGNLEVAAGPAWHLTAAGAGKPFARGADHAAITCQRPVRVGVHGLEMLPP